MSLCKQRQNKLKIEEMLNIGKKWPTTCYICPHITVGLFLRVSVAWVDECGFQQVGVLTRMATLFEHSLPQHSHRSLCCNTGKTQSTTSLKHCVCEGYRCRFGYRSHSLGDTTHKYDYVLLFFWQPLWQMFTWAKCRRNQIKINLITNCIFIVGCFTFEPLIISLSFIISVTVHFYSSSVCSCRPAWLCDRHAENQPLAVNRRTCHLDVIQTFAAMVFTAMGWQLCTWMFGILKIIWPTE